MGMYEKVSHVGLDNHKNFSVLSARDAENHLLFRRRLQHRDRPALRQELARFPQGTVVIIEGTFGWGWMADEWAAAGHRPFLASSRKVAAWREARGLAKNDRLDADLLSELWPQEPQWWKVWLAPPEVRDQREILRYRMALVQVQTMTKNRIHGALHRHGIVQPFSDLFGQQGLAFLKELQKDADLRKAGRLTLLGHLQLLRQVRYQLAVITRRIRKMMVDNPEVQRWRKLPGIGQMLAFTIAAEFGNRGRFLDDRHATSYALLVPRADETGDSGGGARHVGHVGRRTLQWAFVEAAHGAIRKSPFFRALFERCSHQGHDRGSGYLAVARKLCRVGLALKEGESFQEVPPPRPGSPEAKRLASAAGEEPSTTKEKTGGRKSKRRDNPRNSRGGLGQPQHPMAADGTP